MENDNTNDPQGAAQSPSASQQKKSFANSFAYLKNTDLYKLPEKPAQPVAAPPRNSNAIIVNSCQRGNPILKFVRNVPYEYGEIIPDYQLGERHCALFLSLRYHNLNPNYIHDRLAALGNKYDLRIILCQVDVKNCRDNLKELSKMCMLANCTLILAWSAEEAGRYLETYKQYENKPPDILQERVETDYFAQLQDVLTTVKSVNKTDALTLLSSFGSLKNIINAKKEEFLLCPGFGEQKAQRLYKVFNEPFKRTSANENIGAEPESSSITDGTLPPTSKLKRPYEINKICSDELESKTPPTEETSKKLKRSPAKVPKQKDDQSSAKADCVKKNLTVKDATQSPKSSIDTSPMKASGDTLSTKKAKTDSDNKNLTVKDATQSPKSSIDTSPMKESGDTLSTRKAKTDSDDKNLAVKDATQSLKRSTGTSPMKESGDTLSTRKVDLSPKKKTSSEASPSKQLAAKSSYLSKTQAVLNAGLSRYKKNTTNVSPCKAQTTDRVPAVSPVTTVLDKQLNKQHTNSSLTSDGKRGAVVNVTGTLKPCSDDKQGTLVKVTEISKPSSTVTSPASLSINAGRNQTGVEIKSPSRTSRVLKMGRSAEEKGQKFRVGTRVSKVISPPAETTSPATRYSREITNEEYDDLLASDDEEDDEDMMS